MTFKTKLCFYLIRLYRSIYMLRVDNAILVTNKTIC